MPTPTTPVIAYRTPPPVDRSRGGSITAMLLTLPAAATLFLPFAFGLSPAYVAGRGPYLLDGGWDPLSLGIVLLGLGFAAGPLAFLCRLRAALGAPRAIEATVAWAVVIAAAVAAVAAAALIAGAVVPASPAPVVGVVAAPVVIVLAATAVASGVRRGAGVVRATAGAMLGAYAANAATALIVCRDEPEIGYWVTVLATALAACELVALAVTRRTARPPEPGV